MTTTSPSPAPLPTARPEALGIDPAGVDALLDALEGLDREPERVSMHSLMLVRHGAVAAEGWWAPFAPERPHLLYSLSKSFTSAAAGFAVEEGLLDLDRTVVSYFPEFDADIVDERSRRILVRHALSMASGHSWDAVGDAFRTDPAEPVRGFLLTPPDHEPGTVFAYNQPCTYSVAAIIQRAAGVPLTEYLRPRLLDPLGIGEVGWQQHPPGRDAGFSGLHATTEAIARLGLLHLQRGRWDADGRGEGGAAAQLLPEAWVDEATRSHVSSAGEGNPDWSQGYGFQFWIARHGYRGDGAYGQFCVVLPEHDLVFAGTSETIDMQAVLDAVWTHLLPALHDAPLPESPATTAAGDALAARLAALQLAPAPGSPAGDAIPDALLAPDGAAAEAQPTLTGLRVLPGGADGDEIVVELHEGDLVHTATVAAGSWAVSDEGVPTAGSGGLQVDGSLRLEIAFLETPHRLVLTAAPNASVFSAAWSTVPLRAGTIAEMRMPRDGTLHTGIRASALG